MNEHIMKEVASKKDNEMAINKDDNIEESEVSLPLDKKIKTK
jgi:hypothetical protein